MFSRFSLYLEKHDAVTPQELVTAIEASYTPTPKVHEIKETYNIKDLFQPYLEDIHGHTGPHHFRFRLVGEEVELKYKNWSTEKEWLPVSGNIKVLQAGCPTLCSLVPPKAEELGLEKLMKDIKHQSEYISPAQCSEWEALVDRLSHQEASCEPIHLPILQWSSATSPSRSASMSNSESAQVHDPAIARLLQKESEQHEVRSMKLQYTYELLQNLGITFRRWTGNKIGHQALLLLTHFVHLQMPIGLHWKAEEAKENSCPRR